MPVQAFAETVDQRIARPVLVGREELIVKQADELGIDLTGVDLVDVASSPLLPELTHHLYESRQRKGVTPAGAAAQMRQRLTFGLAMVAAGHADGFVGGATATYADTIRPAIQIVGLRPGISRASALQLLVLDDRLVFCADTMINIEPTAEELAEIAELAADTTRLFDIVPRTALLSFSSFGSVRHPQTDRVARAAAIVQERRPDLVIDGEMHVEAALVEEIATENYPHSRIRGDANVLVFPGLAAANIGYKLVQRLGRADAIGPMLMGMRHPIGPFLGAIVFVLLQTFAIDLIDRERFNLVIGGVFLAIVMFSPDGLLGLWARLSARFRSADSPVNPRPSRRH